MQPSAARPARRVVATRSNDWEDAQSRRILDAVTYSEHVQIRDVASSTETVVVVVPGLEDEDAAETASEVSR